MIDGGTRISFSEYESALKNQAVIAKKYDEIMGNFDIVLSPSTADEAPVGLDTPDIPDHCLIFTMCYAPTISVPLLYGTSGLPVGIQVAAKRFNDYDLLDFADFLCHAVA
jgi:Asp-tRNA(Asn)/Glu-tRNA(Gln) amidotransferase A subunit family amidase